MSLRRPTAALLIYLYLFEESFQTLELYTLFLYCIFIFYLHACIMNFVYLMADVMVIGYFRSMITPCYIIPAFLMFASTFKRTHWLVPGYCLGQISRMEIALRWQPRNPRKGDSSLAKIGVILVSCSCGKWSPIDADVSNRFRPQPLETKCCTPRPKWSCTTYFCSLLGILVSSWYLIS